MDRRQLTGLILASALVTLDGTATTVALPTMGRELSASVWYLQWIANAPLLVLSALLLPAGSLADRYGRTKMMRAGLTAFVAGSVACAFAQSPLWLIGAKLLQGAGGALVLPAALAALRSAHTDAAERTRVFGVWAAWTGAASAAGPLLAGALVDVASWRAVFAPPVVAGAVALLLLRPQPQTEQGSASSPVPRVATLALMVALGGFAYFLMQSPETAFAGARVAWPLLLAVMGAIVLLRNPHRHVLFPRELLAKRNCVAANAASFAFYFGMFGVSFLVVLYVQQVLRHSASWAAVVLLPISVMLLFAERFGRLTARFGTRLVVVAGAVVAGAGIAWMGTGSHPMPFWSHMVVGTALLGFGISLAVSALTNAAVAAVPETSAAAASALNHAVVRVAGLVSVALLGSIAAPGASDAVSAEGMRRAMIVCAAVVAIGGVWSSLLIRDEEPGGLTGTD